MEKITPIIGMSPGNSYFKFPEVTYLLSTTIALYGHTAIFIPDVPAISTYLALGYPLNRAREKALSKGRNLKNRVIKCAEELGLSMEKVQILDWERDIEAFPGYQGVYQQFEHLHEIHLEFQQEANASTLQTLEQGGKPFEDLGHAAKIGVQYLLSELAFLAISSDILHAQKTVMIYHRPWPIYAKYLAGIYDGKPKPSLDFFLLPPFVSTEHMED